MSILPCSWDDACLQEGENCLLFSLPGALPESQASGRGEGRSRLRQRFLPCLRTAVRSRGSGCSPGASEAPREIRSNQDLKGANVSQERGQNSAHFCCFASVPMQNNGSHCQSSWEPRACFWAPIGKSRLLRGAWQLGMSRNPQWDRGRNLLPAKQEEKQLSFSESWSHLPRLAEV